MSKKLIYSVYESRLLSIAWSYIEQKLKKKLKINFLNRTFSMITSFISVRARIAILLFWSRILTINSAPPCSRKFFCACGKFLNKVDNV